MGVSRMRRLRLTKIRDLDVSPSADAEATYLSAASGLVRAGLFLYVVADDELHLGVFGATGNDPGHVIRLFEGALPTSTTERKKLKPDLETLMTLPVGEKFPHGAILALGSGSKRNRRMGSLLRLDAHGAVRGSPDAVDLAPIFSPLDDVFREPNIEGAVIVGDEVRLFQRGNKRDRENAIIRYPLSSFLGALNMKRHRAIDPVAITMVDLGEIDGIPFSFTDAAALPDGDMLFTAVAEDTDDAYNDGPCAAAIVGLVSGDGHVRRRMRLDAPHKVEGVEARVKGDVIRLLLVTDADDPAIPAGLFSATMER
jgi:hypothetical protein